MKKKEIEKLILQPELIVTDINEYRISNSDTFAKEVNLAKNEKIANSIFDLVNSPELKSKTEKDEKKYSTKVNIKIADVAFKMTIPDKKIHLKEKKIQL